MKTANQAMQNSLRCLQHPLSLACIALLLLNDHVLKVFYPSWLTGKLSDFAGLFFFPFIVTAGLGILFSKRKLEPRPIGRLAFASVALWFTVTKTLPAANEATNMLLSSLVGHSVRLLIDPSDLIGLIALWPAWKIWRKASQTEFQKISYAPLVAGLVACIATSPAAPMVEVVTHLSEKDGSIFAFDSINGRVAMSNDGGKAWGWTDAYDSTDLPSQLKTLPVTMCLPNDLQQCYRVNGESIVEESMDGGQSWSTSWQLPADRAVYMGRIDPDIDLGPYDILIVEWQGQRYVFVAAGEEGILRREIPGDQWDRIAVERAVPTPIKSATLSDAISILWRELLIWFLLSIVTFGLACWKVWSVNSKIAERPLSKGDWVFSPSLSPITGILVTLLAILLIGFGYFAAFEIVGFQDTILKFVSIFFILCVGIALLLLPFIIYRALKKWKLLLVEHHYPPHVAQRLTWTAYFSHVSVFAAGSLIWLCWTVDIISTYSAALAGALVITGFVAALFLKKVETLSHKHEIKLDS